MWYLIDIILVYEWKEQVLASNEEAMEEINKIKKQIHSIALLVSARSSGVRRTVSYFHLRLHPIVIISSLGVRHGSTSSKSVRFARFIERNGPSFTRGSARTTANFFENVTAAELRGF
jgi:hypothetical protein